MPPRLNKRQQRELEELQALGGRGPSNLGHDDVSSGSEGEDLLPVSKAAAPMFSNFLAPEEFEDEDEEGVEGEGEGVVQPAKARKKKKNKKKTQAAPSPSPAATPTSRTLTPTPVTPTPRSTLKPKNEKKALKKAKAKEKKADEDDLDQALAELSIKYPNLRTSTSTTSPSHAASHAHAHTHTQTLPSLLSVSLPHLDPEAEMRKFFGSRVIQASKSPSSSPSSSAASYSRGAGAGGGRRAQQRSNLTRPRPTWWSASQREGLSVRVLRREELDEEVKVGVEEGEKWWTVEYSQRYKSLTKLFIQAVMSGHPDALWEVQRKLPWHADNLLQLAEVYRHREEYAQAVDFVDRALFTYERAFIGAFTFTSGTNRLDFRRVENRPFFLGVHRVVGDLQRRGCVRTAFEFARLLYGLDPWTDPHGAVYHLDMLGVKSGMGMWVVEVFEYFAEGRGWGRGGRDEDGRKGMGGETRMDPSVLPGWAYARALALRMKEDAEGESDHETSTEALKEALLSFPSVVPLLADKIDVALPAYIRGHPEFRIETGAGTLPAPTAALHALSHMYAQRSSGLWKDPTHATWFQSTVTSVFSPLISPSTTTTTTTSPLSPSSSSSSSSSSPSSSLPTTPQRKALLTLLASPTIQESLWRHITVVESTTSGHAAAGGAGGRLSAWIPRAVLVEANARGGGGGLACDPMPPRGAVSRYDEVYFEGVEDVFVLRRGGGTGGGGGGGEGGRRMDERVLLEGLGVGEGEMRGRILEILENLGGGEGLAGMLERMGPEAVEDVLGQVQAVVMAEDHQGGMPGEMPGMNVVPDPDPDAQEGPELVDVAREEVVTEEREEESESGSDEEDPSPVQRVLRGILGRFWGGATVAGDETSADEDEDEEGGTVDRNGVD